MPFSEDDLRKALKRKDPGPEFTDRVMARVKQKASAPQTSRPRLSWLAMFRFSPALVAASIALVLVLGAWIGYQTYQRHLEQARIEKLQREAEEQKAEQQARLALRIASQKLNHVFQTVSVETQQNDNVRRQRL
jgi:flagellar biosynthesis component FlhA